MFHFMHPTSAARITTEATASQWRVIAKRVAWVCWGIFLVICLFILIARHLFLTHIGEYNRDITSLIGQALNAEVSIERFEPDWDLAWPRLRLVDVRIRKKDATGQMHTALALPRVDTSLYWRSLLGSPVFRLLRIENAELSIRRIQDDHFEIASYPVRFSNNTPSSNSNNPFAEWITHQGRIDLLDTKLTYDDDRLGQTRHEVIRNLNLTFQNGVKARHLGVQALFHDKPLDFRLNIDRGIHETADWRQWAGKFFLNAGELNVREILNHTPYGHLVDNGVGGIALWADFANAEIVGFTADVVLKELQMRFAPKLRSFQANDLSARLRYRHQGNSLELEAENLRCILDGKTSIGPVNLRSDLKLNASGHNTLSGKTRVNALHLALANHIGGILPDVPELDEFVRQHNVEGLIRNATYSWEGPALQPTDWKLETEFEDLSLASTQVAGQSLYDSFGYAKATGALEFAPKSGRLQLEQLQMLSLPGLFQQPDIQFLQSKGSVSWERQGNKFTSLSVDQLHLKNKDLDLTIQGKWSADETPFGTIDMTAKVDHLVANRAFAYLPLSMDSGARQWIEKGILGGVAEQGTVTLKGALDRFPWGDPSDKGLFEAKAKLRDASIDYVPEARENPKALGDAWPTLTDIQGTLEFVGRSMIITAQSAKTAGVNTSDTRAVIEDFESPNGALLQIDGHAHGNFADMVRYLDISPVGPMLNNAFLNSEATDTAKLDLQLKIPLAHADTTQVKGIVHLNGNTLKMPWPVPELRGVSGDIHFTEQGVEARQIQAQALAGDATINITTDDQHRIGINASGSFHPDDIRYFQDTAIVKAVLDRFSGTTPFLANIDIDPALGVTIVAETKLSGITSSLPEPLAKSETKEWPTRFSWTPTRHSGQNGNTLSLTIADKAQLSMLLPKGISRLKPHGTIAIGCTAKPARNGLGLVLKLPQASVDAWRPIVESLIVAGSKDEQKGTTSSLSLNGIHANLSELTWGGHQFPALRINASRSSKNRWRASLKSPLVDGVMTWDSNVSEMGRIQGAFRKLHVPSKMKAPLQAALERGRKHAMPDIDVTVSDFAFEDVSLGRMELKGSARRQGNQSLWSVEECVISNSDAQLKVSGVWDANNESHLNGSLEVTDGGKLLDRFSLPGILEKTHGHLSTDLRWKGAPWSPQIDTIDGSATIDLHRGVLQKVDTGVGGTVLSLVSTQSLFKRLTLDFFDLTHSAYTFDTCDGKLIATAGNITTENMKVVGPKASVLFSGSSNLSNQNIDAKAIVIPDVNIGAASLALTLVNPALGIGTFVTQWLLSDPISKMMATEYTITGTWQNPDIRTQSTENTSRPSSP